MVVEFYGDISDYTKRRADKLRKRFFRKMAGRPYRRTDRRAAHRIVRQRRFYRVSDRSRCIGLRCRHTVFCADAKDDGKSPLDFSRDR